MMKQLYKITLGSLLLFTLSCADFLDIVPDNVATIEYAFRMRATAEQALSTCYSYMPNHGDYNSNPAIFGADEFWLSIQVYEDSNNPWAIARGKQNRNSPLVDYWGGLNGGKPLWEGISQCNMFLDNIMNVPDMEEDEKRLWAAEVKFLKAYYHFYLLRAYGPIPIRKENLPISASGEEVRVYRDLVDDVYDYIIELIDEAVEDLPNTVRDETTELGRITKPIALSLKAKILVYAASPLFNGNTDYNNFKNHEGIHFFNQEYSEEKWDKAIEALKVAIDLAHSLGHKLYEFNGNTFGNEISPETRQQLTHRGIVTERWNSELIWVNTNSRTASLQGFIHPRHLDAAHIGRSGSWGSFGTTFNMASLYYSENGVPINEDRFWEYHDRFNLRVATLDDQYNIKPGYETAVFNFNREPRFYASLGFDGGIWYGHDKYDDKNTYHYQGKRGQPGGKLQAAHHAVCGYYPKKLDYYQNTNQTDGTFSVTSYPWVLIRLGDLYLLYAEALNERYGPTSEAIEYIDKIRDRAGLLGIEESWSTYSNSPAKFTTQDGLREIIHRERTIEMMFEGQRFWDLRRWKTAMDELNQAITGWDVDQADTQFYYRHRKVADQTFEFKDYFWPLREYDIIVNKNLIQNEGWDN